MRISNAVESAGALAGKAEKKNAAPAAYATKSIPQLVVSVATLHCLCAQEVTTSSARTADLTDFLGWPGTHDLIEPIVETAMAFAAVVDVCVHLHSFRNVDLFHQGLYQLRFRAYQDTSEAPGGLPLSPIGKQSPDSKNNPPVPPAECVALVPYNLLPAPLRPDVRSITLPSTGLLGQETRPPIPPQLHKVDYHCVSGAKINPDTQTFYSRSFLIRYCDEEVALDEACCFRLEVDLCKAGAIQAPVYLEVDLMFADSSPTVSQQNAQQQKEKQQVNKPPGESSRSGGAGGGSPGSDAFVSPLRDVAAASPPVENTPGESDAPEFVSVSYQIFRLNSAVKGTLESLPIVFDEFHFAHCSATIHSLLVDVRQRLRFVPSPLAYFPRHRHRRPPLALNYGPSGTEEHRPTLYIPSSQPRLARSFSDIIPPLRSVEQFVREGHKALPVRSVVLREPLVGGPHQQHPTDWISRAEQIHMTYIEMLLQSLLRLICTYRSLCNRCLNASERSALSVDDSAAKVTLPGNDNILVLQPGVEPLQPRPSEACFQLKVYLAPELNDYDEPHEGSTILAFLPTLRSRLADRAVPSDVGTLYTADFFLLGGQISELWGRLCLLLPVLGSRCEHFLRLRSERQTLQRWRTMVVQEGMPSSELLLTVEGSIGEAHAKRGENLRRSLIANFAEPAPVTDLFLPAGPELQPLIFEQLYYHAEGKTENLSNNEDDDTAATEGEIQQRIPLERMIPDAAPSVPKSYTGIHLFILVHGFQGNSYDMRLFQNTISLACPGAVCLCSSANEENTEGDIDTMGARLAEEINKYISNWCKDSILGRISFICHSLGGVIARAALTRLQSLYGRLHTYVSLSSPHLGYSCSANKLVDAGMWVLKKWRKSECLQQLTLSDNKNPRESFVFKLAENSEAMGHFKHVCLLSSWQDQYVPFESARIEVSQKLENENKMRSLYAEMAKKILSRIKPENFRRLDVNFKIAEKSLDSLIGRAAHIQFLENQLLMRMLTLIWSDLFT